MRVLVACEWSNTVRDAFLVHGYIQNKLGSGKSQERSRTFPGIARAMAEQWG